jgi:2-polyprenyl-3-methyl-5-hydroxy-6-metoxy-1,4-benzoquinol methylase
MGANELDSVRMEDIACPNSCPKEDEIILSGFDRINNLPGQFDVVKCRTCGLMRTNPRPTSDTIGFYYPEDYGPYIGTQVRQAETKTGFKKILKPLIGRIFNNKSQEVPRIIIGRMVEIGCASGAFLHKMASQGWLVEGVEFNEKAAQNARRLGYKVHVGPLESAPMPSHPVDLIVGWMVLEHLHNPIECLKKLYKWSNTGAWLVLSVPNASAFEFSIFKGYWYDLHLPNHLYHFTPQTLAQVLEAGGWKLEKIHHQRSIINLIVSMSYVLDSKSLPRLGKWLHDLAFQGGKWFYLLFPVAWVLSILGKTGRMTVWARK